MKLLSRNFKGFNTHNKQHLVKHRIEFEKAYIILLQETKLSTLEMKTFSKKAKNVKLGAIQFEGASSSLAIFWSSSPIDMERIGKGVALGVILLLYSL